MSRVPLDKTAFNLLHPNSTLSLAPGRKLIVYNRGTTDEAVGYTSEDGSETVSYPLTADKNGRFNAWYPPGPYDLYDPIDDETQPWEAVVGIDQAEVANIKQQQFNVLDFGAKGDGTTDDGAACQAAMDAAASAGGGVVIFPPHRSYILRNLHVRSNTTVVMHGATLQQGGSQPLPDGSPHTQHGIFQVFGDQSDYEQDIQFIGGTIIGDRNTGSWDVDGDDGIQLIYARNVDVLGIHFIDVGQDCVEPEVCENVLIQGNVFEDCSDACIDIRQGSTIRIIGNYAYRCRNLVHTKPDAYDVRIVDNYAATYVEGVSVHGVKCIIDRNHIASVETPDGKDGADHPGIAINGHPAVPADGTATDNFITNNTVIGRTNAAGIEAGTFDSPHLNMRILNNMIEDCARGIHIRGTAIIEDNEIRGMTNGAITITNNGSNLAGRGIVRGNWIEDVDAGTGYVITLQDGGGNGVEVCDNVILGASGNSAIFLPAGTFGGRSHDMSNSIISGNRIEITGAGIRTGTNSKLTVVGNHIRCSSFGIEVGAQSVVAGNVVLGSGTTSGTQCVSVRGDDVVVSGNYLSGGGNAVRVVGVDNALIVGNRLTGANFQGINVQANSDNTQIRNNYIAGNNTGAISDNGTGTVLRGNGGYVTEARGTGTIDDTQTSEQITHGLATTPTSVVVTPRDDELIWVSARSSSTFTVTRTGSSGALDFDWRAEV